MNKLLTVICWQILCSLQVEAFSFVSSLSSIRHVTTQSDPSKSFSSTTLRSSYDIDSDEDAEQRMGEHTVSPVSQGLLDDVSPNDIGRYDNLLSSVGLQGQLKHVGSIPKQRTMGCYDVFCNRELSQDKLTAVGFDMDYTLAQYQQPAFDKLAFDGAKAKLVEKLGYPKEVLDFEYDHEVSSFCSSSCERF